MAVRDGHAEPGFMAMRGLQLVKGYLGLAQGDWALGYHSMKFRHFPRQLVYTMVISNNRASFHLW